MSRAAMRQAPSTDRRRQSSSTRICDRPDLIFFGISRLPFALFGLGERGRSSKLATRKASCGSAFSGRRSARRREPVRFRGDKALLADSLLTAARRLVFSR